MEGFRAEYEKAIRVEERHDWTHRTLDYGAFKKRLLSYSDRRVSIRAILRRSPDRSMPEETLTNMVGPKVRPTPKYITIGGMGSDPGYASMDQYGGSDSASSFEIPGNIFTKLQRHIKKNTDDDSLSSTGSDAASNNPHKRVKTKSIMRRLSNVERREIYVFLETEMEKVAQFYTAQWQKLSRVLIDEGPSDELGQEILEVLALCTMNVLAVRQSLIRYDAFVRTYGGSPMMFWYLKKRMLSPDTNALKMIHHHDELKDIMDAFYSEYTGPSRFKFLQEWAMFQDVFDHLKAIEKTASAGTFVIRDTFISTLRHYFLLGMIEDNLGLEPSYLTMRGKSLTKDMHRIVLWRKGVIAQREPATRAVELSFYQYWALGLNLVSAFLYCMNYYIVEPSSTRYVNALGASDSISGALIGMMPMAAMMSAVVYAIWTNRSYREPFIVSGILMVSGNLVYASALKPAALWLALLGRFMTGLGGPKCFVRRYMADTTPVKIRTSVNAVFGMAVAVGSALGPATAIMLNRFEFSFEVPFIGEMQWNGMTAPGFFMAGLWSVFLLIVIVTFGEPDRAGLEEQKRKEKASTGNTDDSGAAAAALKDSPTRVIIEKTPSAISDGGNEKSDSRSPSPSPAFRDRDEDVNTIFSGEVSLHPDNTTVGSTPSKEKQRKRKKSIITKISDFMELVIFPVRLCLGLLFAKVFVIEALVSCTSALTRNRYAWDVPQVGTLGCINGLLVVPLSIFLGWLSMFYQDRVLMVGLVSIGALGMFLLIDISDLISAPTAIGFNENNILAVHPPRYVAGYFLTYCSIQSFEGVIGSALSKVIPTALASGTFNSGLLATLVDTLGRTCGDFFIAAMGTISIRQLMNLLFIPAFCILMTCLYFIRKYYDMLAV